MHAVQLEEELRGYDVYLYSVTEQIDTTSATGRFNFRIWLVRLNSSVI